MSPKDFSDEWDRLNEKYAALQVALADSVVRAWPDNLVGALALDDMAYKDTARFMRLYNEASDMVKGFRYVANDYKTISILSNTAPGKMFLDYTVKGKYILLSAHREENIDTEKNFMSLFTAINKMAEKYDMPILYSCHPRSRKRLEQSGFKLDSRVIQHEPLGFHDYNCLQMNAFAVVSDSGTLPEESSFFTSVGYPFPAICIRTSTERPEAIDKACFIIAGIDEKSLLQAVDTAVTLNQNGDYGIPVPDYIEENVSTKVVKIIQSYVGIVNKMVWRKF